MTYTRRRFLALCSVLIIGVAMGAGMTGCGDGETDLESAIPTATPTEGIGIRRVVGDLLKVPTDALQIDYMVSNPLGTPERLVIRQGDGLRRYDAAQRPGADPPISGNLVLDNPKLPEQHPLAEPPDRVYCSWYSGIGRSMATVSCTTSEPGADSISVFISSLRAAVVEAEAPMTFLGDRSGECFKFDERTSTGTVCVDTELSVLLLLTYDCSPEDSNCFVLKAENLTIETLDPGIFNVPIPLTWNPTAGGSSGDGRVERGSLNVPDFLLNDSEWGGE